MGAPRLRKTSSRKEFDTLVDDYITQGYEVLSRGEGSTLLRKKQWGSCGGHVLVALLTVWWTIGIGNLVYALVSHFGAEQVMVKLTETEKEAN